MKIRSIFLLSFLLPFAMITAQFVIIPDSAFRQHLISTFPSCFDAQQRLDTTCSAVVNVNGLNVTNKQIRDLSGVQYFDKLVHLSCGNNLLTKMPKLPNRILTLLCANNFIKTFTNLSDSLRQFNCSNNLLTILPSLPKNLNSLNCKNNNLQDLGLLPQQMVYLQCDSNQLTEIRGIPASLTSLTCSHNLIEDLINTSDPNDYQINILNCSYNNLDSLPNYPLSSLICEFNRLKTLPPYYEIYGTIKAKGNCFDPIPVKLNPFSTVFEVVPNNPNCVIISLAENLHTESNTIFPNPAKDKLYLNRVDEYIIFNSSGKAVVYGNADEVNVSGFPMGIYSIKIRGKIVRFVKE